MKHILLAAALVCAPVAVLADIVGTYVAGDGKDRQTLTLSYKDDSHIRMDVGRGNYLLLAGDKAWLVTQQGGGAPMVIDLDTLPAFAMPGGGKSAAGTGKEPAVNITRTGRSETVAGIRGDVYEILADGKRHEVVLSGDRRALALNKAFMALGQRLAQSLGADMANQLELAAREAQKHGYGGLLRSDRELVLQSLQETTLPAAHYALPAGVAPTQMPAMPAFDPALMQQMQQQMQQMMEKRGR